MYLYVFGFRLGIVSTYNLTSVAVDAYTMLPDTVIYTAALKVIADGRSGCDGGGGDAETLVGVA